MITIDTISRHEFIGLETKIIDSSNPQVVGLNGTIINETKSMFTINTEKGMKMIPKSTNEMKIGILKSTHEMKVGIRKSTNEMKVGALNQQMK